PYRDFVASNAVQNAMAGILCRSGLPGAGQMPLLPPGLLSYETAAIQAAWCVLVSSWQRLAIGVGDHLDFSIFEGVAQIFDPILGVTGSAAAGKSAMQMAEVRGRPDAGHLYPIFPTSDGFVRMCILNPRQWQGMCEWLGDDHPFTDPSYGNIGKRMQAATAVNACIAGLTRTLSSEQVLEEGQRRGIPVAIVATPSQALHDPHFRARGAFTELHVGDRTGVVPSGFLETDGVRAGIRTA